MNENAIGTVIINTAITVHRELGSALLESVYEVVLADELSARGLAVECQVPVPIVYRERRFEEGFRADMVVEGRVVLELKSVERITPNHRKQIQTYLRLMDCRLGYLLNFGEALMKNGIVRCVNGLEETNSRGGAGTQRGGSNALINE